MARWVAEGRADWATPVALRPGTLVDTVAIVVLAGASGNVLLVRSVPLPRLFINFLFLDSLDLPCSLSPPLALCLCVCPKLTVRVRPVAASGERG
ncbi:uncharacterized protein PHACADRAFT_264905 [Phanerochaete carnosa HHB-10118-sp]|uniref:Uncharacterized protein n=1 Tax=Phanerochaete carnosa (strain HHB-10118-sp) TaxID=650164 RepID=K5UKZ4_PHACS|nr:uncharacterized protein PHACADRAFT_264905 [Phanerochaete carnosa HHB-10118-sp]EKM50291.1 hypothetical protein PHACADRAFT_264905 [Phanerochaete carnosa HHB-10118-sp]